MVQAFVGFRIFPFPSSAVESSNPNFSSSPLAIPMASIVGYRSRDVEPMHGQ